ncbi:MAG: hypothetical protein E6Q76_03745 [Rhizobium sp.]|nr:MAG: hypothetical protein E6Q76_03745 [Rhizobium sp.]
MKSFSDKAGRSWTIDLTVGCFRRVKALIGVDLMAPEGMADSEGKPASGEQLTLAHRLTADMMLFVDVLYAALKAEADARNVSVQQFCEAIPPDTLREARLIFLGEWEDFFRLLGRDDRAAVIRAAVDLVNEQIACTEAATKKLLEQGLPTLSAEIAKATSEALGQLNSGNWLTSSPASSASTPTR